MITNHPVPVWSQRDPRWAKQRLGTVNTTTIGSHGCAITSIAMMDAAFDPANPWTPNAVDDLFTKKGGYARGNLVIWDAIIRLLPNCSAQGNVNCETVPAPVAELKA